MNPHHVVRLRHFTFSVIASLLTLLSGEPSSAQAPAALEGHLSGVSSAVYSPDGKLLVTGGFDRSVKIWDVATGQELRNLDGHAHQVLSVALHPDGRQIATGSRDNSIKLWDLFIPTPLQSFEGHTAPVQAVLVSGDGQWSATAGEDKTIKLWDAEGKLLRQFSAVAPAAGQTPAAHDDSITRLARNPDGTLIASADQQGWVRIWNSADGTIRGGLGAGVGPITGLDFHPDGSLITASAAGSVKWWKLPLVAPLALPPHQAAVTATSVAPNGTMVLTGAADGVVQWFNGADGKLVRVLTQANSPKLGAIHATALHMPGGLAAAAGAEGVVQLWNTTDGADRLRLAGHTGAVLDLDVNAQGDQWVTAGEDGTIRVWRTPSPALPLTGHTAAVQAIAASADAKLLVTASADKKLRLYNAADQSLVRAIDMTAAGAALDVRPDGAQLASGDDQGQVELWNPTDGASQARLLGHDGPVSGVAYLPDGETMLSTGADGTLRWWNTSPAASKALAAAAGAVQQVVPTSDGAQVLVGSEDGAIRVFTTATGALARSLPGHEGPVTALDTQGPIAVSGGEQGMLRQWTLATGAPLPSVAGHDGVVLDVAVSTAGDQIVSAGDDGLIRLWRLPVAPKTIAGAALAVSKAVFAADGTLVASTGLVGGKPTIVVRDQAGAVKATIVGHTAAVTSLAFSADKTKLISGSADKTAKVWSLANPKEPVAEHVLPAAVSAVAFSANGAEAIAGGANGALVQFKSTDGVEVRKLTGHTGAIAALLVRGATLISGSADQTVRQWNLSNGAAIRSMAHGGAVTSVSASGNGQVIASAGAKKLVKVWNGANGAALATLTGHVDAPLQVAVNAAGTQVVSVAPKQIRHWDVTGQLRERFLIPDARAAALANDLVVVMDAKHALHTVTPSLLSWIAGHEGPVTAVTYAADGKSLASGGVDKTVRLWSVADGKPLATFAGSTASPADVAMSADGKWLAAGGADKTVRVWSVPAQAAAQPVMPLHQWSVETAVTSLSFSADNHRLAVGLETPAGATAAVASQAPTVAVWDVDTGLPLQQLTGHGGHVSAVAFLPDGATVVSGSADKTTLVRTLSALRVAKAAEEGTVKDLSLSADGAWLATAADKQVTLWNTVDGAVRFQTPVGQASMLSVSLNGDHTQLAAVGSDNQLCLWPLTAQAPGPVVKTPLLKAPSPPRPMPAARVRHSADGEQLAIVGVDNEVRVCDVAGQVLEQFGATEVARDVCFTSADSLLLARGNAALVKPLSLVVRLAGHEGPVTAARFLPDASAVISGGMDKSIRRWSLADGKQTSVYTGSAEAITAVDITPDGATLVAGSADKKVFAWSLAAATPTVAPAATWEHPAIVHAIHTNTAGDDGPVRFATAGEDGMARVWDLATGRELQRFDSHEGPIRDVALTVDGKLLTGGDDKTARISTVAVSRLLVASETTVTEALWLPDGAALATTGDAMQVKLWDAEGEPLRQLAGAKAPLQRLAVRGDGLQVAAGDAEGRVLLWNVADGALQQTIETGAAVHALGFSADHQRIAVAGAAAEGAGGRLQVYRTDDAQLLQQQSAPAPLLAVKFAVGDRELLTGAADQAVHLWAFASPEPLAELTGHEGAVLSLEYSPDGATLASAAADGSVRSWNLKTNAAIRTFSGHVGPVYAARFTADGKQLVSCGADGASRLWNVANGAVVRPMATEALEPSETAPALFDVAVRADAQQAAVAGQDGTIRIWNLANGQIAKQIPLTAPVYQLEYRADGQLVAAGHAGEVTMWNAAGTQAHAAKAPAVAFALALHPGNKQAAIPCADGKTYLLTLP